MLTPSQKPQEKEVQQRFAKAWKKKINKREKPPQDALHHAPGNCHSRAQHTTHSTRQEPDKTTTPPAATSQVTRLTWGTVPDSLRACEHTWSTLQSRHSQTLQHRAQVLQAPDTLKRPCSEHLSYKKLPVQYEVSFHTSQLHFRRYSTPPLHSKVTSMQQSILMVLTTLLVNAFDCTRSMNIRGVVPATRPDSTNIPTNLVWHKKSALYNAIPERDTMVREQHFQVNITGYLFIILSWSIFF